jgi:hypothetical protein
MNWQKFTWLLLDNADKYFLIAGPAFLIFYVLVRKKLSFKKIQSRFPKRSDYWRESVSLCYPLSSFQFHHWLCFIVTV